jgi:hypothetical protein
MPTAKSKASGPIVASVISVSGTVLAAAYKAKTSEAIVVDAPGGKIALGLSTPTIENPHITATFNVVISDATRKAVLSEWMSIISSFPAAKPKIT